MPGKLRNIFLITIILVAVRDFTFGAGKDDFPAGKIIDTVQCSSNPTFSYSLYLPSNYTDSLVWPVIFVFDPAARGSLAVSGFVPAAEKFGFIVVCSNDSRNRISWNVISAAISCVFDDVEKRFSINKDRIYTSGFSGGSRVASAIALQNRIVSGVIACGAGFPDGKLNIDIPSFSYLGLVGNTDMNYIEMCDLQQRLEMLGNNAELWIFEGGHKWPEPQQLLEAVEWLELQAMIRKAKNKDPVFISYQFGKYKHKAEFNLEEGKLPESVRFYKYMLKNFPDHDSITMIRMVLDSLQLSKDYKKGIREWNKNRELEIGKESKLGSAFLRMVKEESESDSLLLVVSEQVRILKAMGKNKDPETRAMSSRILMWFGFLCYETGFNSYNLNKFDAASLSFRVQLLIEPENVSLLLLHSKACAQANDFDSSLSSLKEAIKLGYNNREVLEKDPAFSQMRKATGFRKLLNDM